MQNRVYSTAAEALSAMRAPFTLATCARCGFTFNSAFDPSVLVYDEHYDNRVPSDLFAGYYASVAHQLSQRYNLSDGLVVEIGCGKGAFLAALAREWPACRFLGVDPGYEPEFGSVANVRFIADVFRPEHIEEKPSLVVCRHTLEHVEAPVAFLRGIRGALPGGVPTYLEVPDLRWIVESRAFWDFCYEHCNYFTRVTLANIVERAGFQTVARGVGFGNQYLWLEAVTGESGESTAEPRAEHSLETCRDLRQYSQSESRQIADAKAAISAEKSRGVAVCLWGMATKGVVFSYLVDPDGVLLRHCIDVNTNKQGKYSPGSAHLIEPPEDLRTARGEVLILVMNPNYLREIRAKCCDLQVAARFADALCRPLT